MEFIISESFKAFMETSMNIKSGIAVVDAESWQKINELEGALSCQLLIFKGERIFLTTDGETLYQKLNPLYIELKKIERRINK